MENTNNIVQIYPQNNKWFTLGPSKVASTISSTLIKKRPATDAGTIEAKKIHLESSTTSNSGTTSSENGGATKNGV